LYTIQSLMVSVAVSKLGCTHLLFVDPGVKINGCYYRELLLSQQLSPAIWQVSGDFFVFQQDSASAHMARETIKLLQWETPTFISPDLWPPNSPDLNPVDYKIRFGEWCKIGSTRKKWRTWTSWESNWLLVEVWAGLQQNVIDDAIDQWCRRLRVCVRARGGHFEYLLWPHQLPRIWFVKFVENFSLNKVLDSDYCYFFCF